MHIKTLQRMEDKYVSPLRPYLEKVFGKNHDIDPTGRNFGKGFFVFLLTAVLCIFSADAIGTQNDISLSSTLYEQALAAVKAMGSR
jgi:hypothetical protein